MNKDNIEQLTNLENIESSMFEFVQKEKKLTDSKIATKRIGYFKDALLRFSRNKASVVAAAIIAFLFLFAIFAPIFASNTYTKSVNDINSKYYEKLLPKVFEEGTGFWDGCETKKEVSETTYLTYLARGAEFKRDVVNKVLDEYEKNGKKYYDIRYDTYAALGIRYITFTSEEYQKVQKYQDEKGVQIIYPYVRDIDTNIKDAKLKSQIWYKHTSKGVPLLDGNGNFISIYSIDTNDTDPYTSRMRVAGDPGNYSYSKPSGTEGFECRVSLYDYFVYLYEMQPEFIFGTDTKGLDIFTRLGKGAQLSFILSFFVAAINLVIGAIWGAIAGYFGGATDLIMERITDILGNVPFMIVTTLFQLHLASKVGAIPSLLFAFVTTGWIGTAGTVRMQFYRFKNQEYVMAARTLGAKDSRVMFKHIFPNALGTIITSSVLVIPSVIFSESSLTYLGIINLEGSGQTSVGTMLAHGKECLQDFPHVIFFPALFISLLMITFNLFGNGLRDAFNPSLRGSED